MKYLKKFNESTDSLEVRMQRKVDIVSSEINKFVDDFSDLIATNYEIYDLDENSIKDVISKYSTANKGEIKIPYIEIVKDDRSDNIGRVVALILNFGYSLGYWGTRDIFNELDIDFSEFVPDMFEKLHFDRTSDNKLDYKGPVIHSSSILATTPNINDQVKKMRELIHRYHGGDYKTGELRVFIGCIYQYGYGYGHDKGYIEKMDKFNNLSNLLNK